jgi:leucyl-tRNA synthetase
VKLVRVADKSLELCKQSLEIFNRPRSVPTAKVKAKYQKKNVLFVGESWPKYDPKLIKDEEFKIAVQINGKVRAEIFVGVDESEEDIKKKVLENEAVKRHIDGKDLKKFIYIKNRLVNIVV